MDEAEEDAAEHPRNVPAQYPFGNRDQQFLPAVHDALEARGCPILPHNVVLHRVGDDLDNAGQHAISQVVLFLPRPLRCRAK